jgi:hypothetical protein
MCQSARACQIDPRMILLFSRFLSIGFYLRFAAKQKKTFLGKKTFLKLFLLHRSPWAIVVILQMGMYVCMYVCMYLFKMAILIQTTAQNHAQK